MPTPITHIIASLPMNTTVMRQTNTKKILFWSLVITLIPDIDLLGNFFNIPINNIFGHRGFTHSLIFAFFLAAIISLIFWQEFKTDKKRWFLIFGNFLLVALMHPLLDALTDKNYGVALLSPFSNHRFSLPWAPINDSALGIWNYYVLGFWQIIKVEAVIILAALLYTWLWHKYILKTKLNLLKREKFEKIEA
jgi:inner membrane protein